MNTYPLNIQHSYAGDDSCQIQLYSRGRHPEKEFLEACSRFYAHEWDGKGRELPTEKPVTQTHWRTVPAPEDSICETQFVESKPGKGAYPVTILDVWLEM
ncbi:MAG: hypothetical protein CMH98_03670 [Oceanospirillaceae bacterium]|nr:hypothetical protein [Oceanospirillaceae bacterium]